MKLPNIIIITLLIVACASVEINSPKKNEQIVKTGNGHIAGVINPIPTTSQLDIKLVLEGEGLKDSLAGADLSVFKFNNLQPGNYTIHLHPLKNIYQYRIASIRNITVANDSISYVGILTSYENEIYEEWNGEKVNINDTSRTGILKGNILLEKPQDNELKNEVEISLNLKNNLNNKWQIHKVETPYAFNINELSPGIYTAYVEIKKPGGRTIYRRKSAYVYNIIIQPQKTAVVELKNFYNPTLYKAIDEYQPILPHFIWNPNYE